MSEYDGLTRTTTATTGCQTEHDLYRIKQWECYCFGLRSPVMQLKEAHEQMWDVGGMVIGDRRRASNTSSAADTKRMRHE